MAKIIIFFIFIALGGIVLGAPETLAQTGAQASDGKRCIALKKKLNGREILINSCNTCKLVRLERSRAGGALPSVRAFVLQPRSTFDVPFKGPGRTRLMGADPC